MVKQDNEPPPQRRGIAVCKDALCIREFSVKDACLRTHRELFAHHLDVLLCMLQDSLERGEAVALCLLRVCNVVLREPPLDIEERVEQLHEIVVDVLHRRCIFNIKITICTRVYCEFAQIYFIKNAGD